MIRPASLRLFYSCRAVNETFSSPYSLRKFTREAYLGDVAAVSKIKFSFSSLSNSSATAVTVSVSSNRSFRYSSLDPSRECARKTTLYSFRATMHVSSGVRFSWIARSITRTISLRDECSSSPYYCWFRFFMKRISAWGLWLLSPSVLSVEPDYFLMRLVSDRARWCWCDPLLLLITFPPLKE